MYSKNLKSEFDQNAKKLLGSEQAHVLRLLVVPLQKGLGTNYQKQRGCLR